MTRAQRVPFTIRDVPTPADSAPKPLSARVGGMVIAMSIAGALGAACTSSTLTSTEPSAPKCQVSAASPAAVVAGGGTTMLGVSAQPECAWVAAPVSPWIAEVTPRSGQGNGEVEVRVAANPAPTPRQGNIQINDGLIAITQEAAPCRFQVTPAAHDFPAAGGLTTVEVAGIAGCAWTAASHTDWITLRSGATGNGPGAVTLAVAANTGAQRTGTVTIAGQSVTVTQAPTGPGAVTCVSTVAPLTSSADATGGQRTVAVTAPAGCAWTAVSSAPWITVTSGPGGTGSGTVGLTVAANTGPQRTGTATIAGQTHTVTQSATAATCSYALNPTSLSVGPAGGVGLTVAVTAAGNCAWTAVSNAAWLTISSEASASGSRTVIFAAAANTGAARSGTLTIGGQLFTVNQAAACSYSINPASLSIGAGGGTASPVGVTAAAGCAWTGVSTASWITVTSGASGSGNGSLTFTVAPNAGAARVGTLTIAGRTFTVNQAALCVYTISPSSQTLPSQGGAGTPVAVATTPGCAWTAQANESWITVTAGASGNGPGTVTFTARNYSGNNDRVGTITIAGRTFTLTQREED